MALDPSVPAAGGAMLGFPGAVAGGLLSAAGSIGGAIFAGDQAKEAASSAQAFSERMANTSWQRGVADMKAAGINPAVAYSQGGAPAPMGVNATQPNYIDAAQFSSSQMLGSFLQAAQVDSTRAQAQATGAQTLKTLSEIPNAASTRQVQAASEQLIKQQQQESAAATQYKAELAQTQNLTKQRQAAQFAAQQALGPTYRGAEALLELGGGAHSAASAAALLAQ